MQRMTINGNFGLDQGYESTSLTDFDLYFILYLIIPFTFKIFVTKNISNVFRQFSHSEYTKIVDSFLKDLLSCSEIWLFTLDRKGYSSMLYESEKAVWLGQCFLSTANNQFLTLYGNLRNADLCALQALSYKNTLLAACTLCGNLLIAGPSTRRGDSP